LQEGLALNNTHNGSIEYKSGIERISD